MLNPFSLSIETIDRMLNFELADHPTYAGLEIQAFDDDVHGTGVAVLANRRRDGRVDVYRQPGLRLDPGGYGIGAGLGEWRESTIAPARLDVTAFGVMADVAFGDAEGRRIEVRVDDTDERRRAPGALLAPFGAAIEQPTSMLLVWMPQFDLVRTGGREPEILIEGRPAATGRLPGARFHGRRLIKYAADLVAVRLNENHDGPLDAAGEGGPGVAVANGGHEARLRLDPALPDLRQLPNGQELAGAWRLDIDDAPSIVSGTWRARRDGEDVQLAMDSTSKWNPGPLPLLMRLVTTIVPAFRSWPLTYRWRASVVLGPAPTMTSRWERTTSARDESYGRVMGVSSR
ncbi:MAG: hypothetical protein FIA92_13850 [Chloroflexi bacterium]|nr:hypothetical protein [Chloroflexota bacterium]